MAPILSNPLNGRPLRVLMTSDAVGGVWTYALELVRALAPSGVEFTLALMGPEPNSRQRADAARLANLALIDRPFKLEWMEEPWRDVAEAGRWLLQLQRETRPDLVHLNGYAHAVLPWNCPVLVAAHSCVASWWAAVKRTPLPAEWSNYRRHVARGLRAAHKLVAPSRAMANSLRQHYNVTQVEVIYNGADSTRFAPAEKEEIVFSAGRLWDQAKNIHSLAKAARQIAWPVYVAGDQRGAAGESLADGEGLRLLGKLDTAQVAGWMARGSIYALPARYEPFGLSVLEAALSGCALVLGDIPSLREIWGPAARYVAPDEPNQLAAVIQDVIQDRAQRFDLADAARRRALEFSTERVAVDYLATYQGLLNGLAASKPADNCALVQ